MEKNRKSLKSGQDKEKTTYKLDKVHKEMIIQMLAEGERPRDILAQLEKSDIRLDPSTITWYKNNYQDEILQLQQEYEAKVKYIPISQRYYRLKTYQRLLDDIMDHLWIEEPMLDTHGRIRKDTGGNIVMKKLMRGNHMTAVRILEAAGKEMEEMSGPGGFAGDFMMRFLKLRGKDFDEFVMYGKMPK